MTDINILFFELIRVVIGNQVCLSHTPSADEWGELYAMAKKQSLVGVCFAGVQKLQAQEQCPPEMLYLQWMGMAAKIQQRNEVVNKQCRELLQRLADYRIRGCVLKGQGVAALYKLSPSSGSVKGSSELRDLSLLRQSGDIDIWIEGGLDKVLEWAKTQGEVSGLNDHHFELNIFSDTAVEVHYTPGTLLNWTKNKKYKKWLDDNEKAQFEHVVKLDNECEIGVPTDAFNLVYMMVHMHRHLFSQGLGLRQVMDYYFVMKHCLVDNKDCVGSENIRQNTRLVVEQLGLDRFAAGLMWVMGQVLGMGMIRVPWCPNEMVGKFLLDEIMRGGNFGHHDEMYSLTDGASHDRRLMEKAVYDMRFWRLFPKECFWSTIDYAGSFFMRYKQGKLK